MRERPMTRNGGRDGVTEERATILGEMKRARGDGKRAAEDREENDRRNKNI
jgi:hypothetical protein